MAARHLADLGYAILDRNFRTRYGELDLVAASPDCLVFCEVKTRVAGGRAGPATALDAVGPAKRRQEPRPRRDRLRFDAIGITLSPSGALLNLEHVPDAFD
jgi:putative endonuclease